MGLTHNVLRQFLRHREWLKGSGNALVVGPPDVYVGRKTLAGLGVPFDLIEAVATGRGSDFHSASRETMAWLLRGFGYTRYNEMDIDVRADLRHDLNAPVPETLHEQFSLIWDNGTVEHIMDISRVMANLVAMTKPGGRIVHTQGIGDQTNAGYWTFSPNFFTDFYPSNGFSLDVIELMDRRGHRIPYMAVATKGSSVGSLIPLRYAPSYYLRLVRGDAIQRLLRRLPIVQTLLTYGPRKYPRLGPVLSVAHVLLGITPRSGADWMLFVVATKKTAVPPTRQIQEAYRSRLLG